MEKTKLSAIQLFAMMFIFELGTALVVSYGITAKKDAWLAILLGMCCGIVLFFIYYFLFRQYPNVPLTEYAKKILEEQKSGSIKDSKLQENSPGHLYLLGLIAKEEGNIEIA